MKVKVSSVILFQVMVLLVLMLMLGDAMDMLPDSLESGMDTLEWIQAASMIGAITFAIWVCGRDAKARKKAAQSVLEGRCAVNHQ